MDHGESVLQPKGPGNTHKMVKRKYVLQENAPISPNPHFYGVFMDVNAFVSHIDIRGLRYWLLKLITVFRADDVNIPPRVSKRNALFANARVDEEDLILEENQDILSRRPVLKEDSSKRKTMLHRSHGNSILASRNPLIP
jgi:hypothetical protein